MEAISAYDRSNIKKHIAYLRMKIKKHGSNDKDEQRLAAALKYREGLPIKDSGRPLKVKELDPFQEPTRNPDMTDREWRDCQKQLFYKRISKMADLNQVLVNRPEWMTDYQWRKICTQIFEGLRIAAVNNS